MSLRQARAVLDEARERLVSVVGGAPGDVVFTGGGTEADNLAVRGVLGARGGVAVCSAIEHHAVLEPVLASGGRTVAVDRRGVIDLDSLVDTLDPEVTLVSVMLVNNEVGTIQPLEAVAEVVRARAPNAVLHTDAAQALCWLDVREHAASADLVTLVAHKCGGPKGTGALWVRRGVRLAAFVTGGRQERNRRAGTENVPAIGGMGAAAQYARQAAAEAAPRIAALRDRLERGVLVGVPDTAVNGDPAARVPNTSNLSFDRVESESLLIALDLEGIAVSSGSACSSGTLEPSHVLKAMGYPHARTLNSIRFSLGSSTTEAEIDHVLAVLPRLVAKLRSLAAR